MDAVSATGWLIFAVAVAVQRLLSVTVTVKEPAHSPVLVAVVTPPLHK